MSDDILLIGIILCVILFIGDPNLMDAVITHIMKD